MKKDFLILKMRNGSALRFRGAAEAGDVASAAFFIEPTMIEVTMTPAERKEQARRDIFDALPRDAFYAGFEEKFVRLIDLYATAHVAAALQPREVSPELARAEKDLRDIGTDCAIPFYAHLYRALAEAICNEIIDPMVRATCARLEG